MKRIVILSLLAGLVLSGCIGWMYHDRGMMDGRRGYQQGEQGPPQDPDAPCSDRPNRRGGRPCT